MRPVFDPALALGALIGALACEAVLQILHRTAGGDSLHLHERKRGPKPAKNLGKNMDQRLME